MLASNTWLRRLGSLAAPPPASGAPFRWSTPALGSVGAEMLRIKVIGRLWRIQLAVVCIATHAEPKLDASVPRRQLRLWPGGEVLRDLTEAVQGAAGGVIYGRVLRQIWE